MDFIAFGEILFDCFESKRTLGGAPLNVSAHLTKLGLNGMIISAVGDDQLGNDALKEIRALGLSTDGISIISGAETGRADITLNGKNADYTFNYPSAWDNIPVPKDIESHTRLLYFGTLAQRNDVSRSSLREILSRTSAEHVFFDVNIRKSFYSKGIIIEGLEKATILKMNDEEVPIILKEAECRSIKELGKLYSIPAIMVTEGKNGTTVFLDDDTVIHQDAASVEVVDTVGAGDSLSAGFLASLLKGKDIKEALRIGSLIADFVVTKQGAIPEYDDELQKKLADYLS